MNKSELASAVAAKSGLTKKDSEKTINAVFDALTDALKAGEKVQVVGFGTFEVKCRPARSGRNPRSGEPLQIAASKSPVFKAGKALKDAVDK
ncbi:MAG: HU family DNA-binding protein [Clostridia bacterium]|nr:HU family DNA-binding protein [Clostridia bacterium]